MAKRDLFSKYKQWDKGSDCPNKFLINLTYISNYTDFDSDDYLKHSALSEVEEAKPKKSKSKGATSKSKTTPKKPKISDQAVQKSSTEDDSDLEDLYKDHVLKFNDGLFVILHRHANYDNINCSFLVSLPEITPPRKTRGRPRKSGQNVSPLPKKSKKNTTNTQSIAVVADSKPTRPTTPENIEMVDLCGPPTPPSLAPIFQKNDVNVVIKH